MKKATAFWDASALVPLCIQEAATPSAAALLKKFAPVAWWGSSVWREILPGDQIREIAADSFQLAASFVWCEQRTARRNFVCADQRLSKAARSAGFLVIELPA